MRQIILALALFGYVACGRLDHLYLPPNHSQQSQSGSFSSRSQPTQAYNSDVAQSENANAYQGLALKSNTFSSSAQPGNRNAYQGVVEYNAYSNSAQSGPINRAANDVPILRLDNNNDGETYSYSLETGNGISAQEQGDARGEGTRAQGGFSYTAPDGQVIQVQYTADENGFQPQGSHLPTAPPVPVEILKALEQNAADEARGVYDDGQYKAEASPSQHYASANNGQYNAGSGAVAVNRQYNSGATNKQYVPPAVQQRQHGGYQY